MQSEKLAAELSGRSDKEGFGRAGMAKPKAFDLAPPPQEEEKEEEKDKKGAKKKAKGGFWQMQIASPTL